MELIVVLQVVQLESLLGTYPNPTVNWGSGGLQFYADQCSPALPNDGVHDDAAPTHLHGHYACWCDHESGWQ